MNQKAKEKLSESIILRLEEVDSTELGSDDRKYALHDLVVLIDQDLEIMKEENFVQVELAKNKTSNYKNAKTTAGKVTGFLIDHVYEFGTLAVTLFIAGAALDADTTGKMIASTALRVLPKPKI